jgi:hypothetical protein
MGWITYCGGQLGSGAVLQPPIIVLAADELPPSGLLAVVAPGALAMLQLGNGRPFHKSEKSCSTGATHWLMLCQGPARHSKTVQPSTARAGTAAKTVASATAAIRIPFDISTSRCVNQAARAA